MYNNFQKLFGNSFILSTANTLKNERTAIFKKEITVLAIYSYTCNFFFLILF